MLRVRELYVRKLINEGGTVRADGNEEFGMPEGNMKSAVTTHRYSLDTTRPAFRRDAVGSIDEWNELANEKVFEAGMAVARINIKARVSVRRDNDELTDSILLP